MVKLSDIFNKNKNKNNKQESLSVRQRVLKKYNLDIDEILDTKIKEKKKLWLQ